MGELHITALLLAIFGLLLAISVISSRTIERLGGPIVLLFLVLGMLTGSEGLGSISFEDYRFAFRIGTAALILVLLDGGLNTSISAVKESIRPAAMLATAGVAGTAGLMALFARLLGLSWGESLLLGAVVSSTDAATVFAVLRGGNLRLPRRLGATLELESGINDPMAVILTLTVTSFLAGEPVRPVEIIFGLPLQLLIGLVVGVMLGWGMRRLLQVIRLTTAGMYPVLTLSLAFVAFGVATLAHGSGFLAVYAAAVVVGNSAIPYRSGLIRIHDAIAWLSQISMFVMLGLLVFPSHLLPISKTGIALALFLACIARPLVVWICLLPFRFPLRESMYLGWVGLRGAVPIILATFPVLSLTHNQSAMRVFDLVFFVVVFNSLIPGATIRWLTRRLKLESADAPVPLAALEINSTRLLNGELLSFPITDVLAVSNVRISTIPFPKSASAVLLVRGEELIAPRGSTILEPGDHVYVFCRAEDKPFVLFLFGRPEEHA